MTCTNLHADAQRTPECMRARCRARRFITCFVTVFATVIAITKDLADVEGDKRFGIQTFATRLGVRNIAFLGAAAAASVSLPLQPLSCVHMVMMSQTRLVWRAAVAHGRACDTPAHSGWCLAVHAGVDTPVSLSSLQAVPRRRECDA